MDDCAQWCMQLEKPSVDQFAVKPGETAMIELALDAVEATSRKMSSC